MPAPTTYRFGRAEVDTSCFRVRVGGAVAPLEPKAFDVLLYLLERRDRVVGKDELLEALWPTFVSESVLPRSVNKIRRALGGDGSFIRTIRGRGYRFEGEVMVTAAPSTQGEVAAPIVPPETESGGVAALEGAFVGREAIVQALRARTDRAIAGAGQAMVIVGEPGVGKTRLAREVERYGASRGMRTAVGRCREGATAFMPWLQLLRATRPAEDGRRNLATFVGELARATPSPEDRFQVFERVVNELTSHGDPMVAVLDDMQWADEGSLRLLDHLLEQIEAHPLALLLTARRDTSAPLLQRVRRLPQGLVVELDELDLSDVDDLVRAALTTPDDEIARQLYERTGGNPFFVVEVLRARVLRERAGGEGGVPASVEGAINLALADLEPDAVAVLRATALCDGDVALSLLAEVASIAPERVGRAVRTAAAAGLVAVHDVSVAVRHDLIREVIVAGLAPDERRRLHEAIARALLTRVRGRDEGLDEVTLHLFEAGPECAEEAVMLARRAAEHATTIMAYEQATDLYRRALEALPASVADAERAELILARAGALRLEGREQAAREASLEAAELAASADRSDLLAWAALGLGTDVERQRTGDDEQRRLLERARDALDRTEEPALYGLLLARLANLPPHVDDVERRRRLAAEAVELARQSLNPRALGATLRAQLVALWGPDGLDARAEVARELVALAEQSGMLDELATARDAMTLVALARGDQLAARHQLAELEKITSRLGRPGRQFRTHWLQASAAITEGRFDDARSRIDESGHLAQRLGDPFAQLLVILLRANLAYDRGEWDGVAVVPEALAEVYPWAGRIRIALGADVLWRRGQVDEARAMLESMSLRELSAIPRDEHWFTVMAVLSMVATRLEDEARASLLYELLSPYANRHAFNDLLATGRGPIRFYLGVLARGLGDLDVALEHLEHARDENVQAGIEPGIVRCDVQIAATLRARAEGDDVPTAEAIEARALAAARSLHLGSQLDLLGELAAR